MYFIYLYMYYYILLFLEKSLRNYQKYLVYGQEVILFL